MINPSTILEELAIELAVENPRHRDIPD